MANKEEIGKVFKDRLDAVDTVPKDAVWTNIAEALDKKKEKKRVLVLPLWGKVVGVAASIALLILMTYPFFGNSNQSNSKEDFVETTTHTI